MRFVHPQYFALFALCVPLFLLALYRLAYKRRMRARFGTSGPLRAISRLSPLRREAARALLIGLVLAAVIVALTHPQWMRERMLPELQTLDTVFLLDVSPSMRATDIRPSRLERALDVIAGVARQKLPDDRIGLVAFSGGSIILSFLTHDASNILYYLDYLRDELHPSLGTNIGRALQNGLTVFVKDLEVEPQAASHKRVFVLVSDGEDHGRELEQAVEAVARRAIKVHTVGIGSKEGAPIPIGWMDGKIRYVEDNQGTPILSHFDERTLRWIAEATGGNAYRAITGHELERIFDDIVLREREITGMKKVVEYEEVYAPVLFAAFGLFLLALIM